MTKAGERRVWKAKYRHYKRIIAFRRAQQELVARVVPNYRANTVDGLPGEVPPPTNPTLQ